MVLNNRFKWFVMISFTTLVVICILILGLIMHLTPLNLITIILISIGACIVGYAIARFAAKYIYSQINIDNGKLNVGIQVLSNSTKEHLIEYILKPNDVFAFILYNYYHNSQSGRVRYFYRWMILIAFVIEVFVIIILTLILPQKWLLLIIIASILALFTLVYYISSPLIMRRNMRGIINRSNVQNVNKLIGKHQLSITTNTMTDKTDIGIKITPWNDVEWIAFTKQYLFISIRDSDPCIIPKTAFTGNIAFKQFIQNIKASHD